MAAFGYRQIAKNIEDMIQNHFIKEGDKLPSERELCHKYNVTRTTIRRAIDLLIFKGIIVRKAGSGTYVEKNHIYFNINEQYSFTEKMKSLGNDCKTVVARYESVTSTNALNMIFNLDEFEELLFIKRIRIVNGAVTTIESTYLRKSLFPEISQSDLEGSMYDYIENVCDKVIRGCDNTIFPVLPDKEVAKLFDVSKDTPVFQKNMISYLSNGQIFEYCEIMCNPKNYKFFYRINRS